MKPLISFSFLLFASLLRSQVPDAAAAKQLDSLILLSRAHTDGSEFDKALVVNDLAEKLALEKWGVMSAQYGSVCFNHGRLLHFGGQYREAETWYLRSKDIREKVLGNKHEDYGKSLNNLAIVYDLMSRYESATPLYLEVLKIRQKRFGEESKPYADVLSNLATSYMEMGEYEAAEGFTLQAMRIREKVMGKTSPDYAASLNNLANLYYVTGNYEKAAVMYQQANDILAETGKKNGAQYALGLDNLGAAHHYLFQYEQAERCYLEAKNIREASVGKSSPEYLNSLSHLGSLCSSKRQFDRAIAWFLEALSTGDSVLGKAHVDNISCLQNLGIAYEGQNNLDKAEAYLVAAREGYAQVLGKNHPNYCIENAAILTKLYLNQGKYEAAKSCLMESASPKRKLLVQASKYLSEQELSAYTRLFVQGLDLGFALAAKQPDVAANCYDEVLFYKGFLLQAGLQMRKAALQDSVSTALSYSLKSCHRKLAQEYAKPSTERGPTGELEAEANEVEKQLARAVAAYDAGIKQVNWQAVQAQLRPGEAAIEFVHFNAKSTSNDLGDSTAYAALLLLPDAKMPVFVPLFAEKQLSTQLKRAEKAQSAFYNQLYATGGKGSRLYDLIWKPIAALMPEITTIYFSPSGLLHRINLGAIPAPDGQPLATKHRMIALNSTRQLAAPAQPATKTAPDAVLYGGIQYDAAPDDLYVESTFPEDSPARGGSLPVSPNWGGENDSILRGDTWKYLRWTDVEISAAAETMKNAGFATTLRKGTQANEASFKNIGANGPSPHILHIATHGFFLDNTAPQKPIQAPSSASLPIKLKQHPMIRSGLVLAGANVIWKNDKAKQPNQEDGILTAYEISQMNLANTELVVLSACETGLGDLVGNEGVYGLQRAFKIAGVRYLIMSLWQVPDFQTQVFMNTFYQHWLAGKTTIPEAFRATQIELKTKYGEASKWAGFVLLE